MGKWKTCFRLLKYSHNFSRSIWLAAILFLLGLGLFVGVVRIDLSFAMLPVIFLLLPSTVLLQLKEDLIYSAMVCAFPKRRFFDTLFSDVLLVSAGVAPYLIYGVLVFLFVENGNAEEFYAANVLWVSSLCIAVIIVLLPMSLKYYWISIITGWFLYMFFQMSLDYLADTGKTLLRVSTSVGFWIGLGMVLAGGVISVVIRRLLYKKPLSKWMVREYLKKMG